MMFFIRLRNFKILNKLGGVIALVLSILILMILPFSNKSKFRSLKFYPINHILFWSFTRIVILLTWIGMRAVEDLYIMTEPILTILYFIINPLISKIWDNLLH